MTSRLKSFLSLKNLETMTAQATANDFRSLGITRILFGLFYFIFLSCDYRWLGNVPDALFDPPLISPAALFDGFPSASFFLILNCVVLVSACFTTIGLFTRLATACWLVSELICLNFRYSFGKIDHTIMISVVLMVMLWVNWGRRFSIDELICRKWGRGKKVLAETTNNCSLSMLSFLLALGFLSAGLPKLIHWFDFDFSTNGFLSWLYQGYYNTNKNDLLADFAMSVRPVWVWEFADYTAIVFELGFLIAMFNGKLWRFWLASAAFFHLSNTLILNIPFLAHAPVYLCFVNWYQLAPKLVEFCHRWSGWGVALLSVTLTAVLIFVRFPEEKIGLFSALIGIETTSYNRLWCGLVLWILVCAILSLEFLRYPNYRSLER